MTAPISTIDAAKLRSTYRRLVVVRGALAGGDRTLVLDGSSVVVGRDAAGADLVLDDQRVSRRHACVEQDRESGAWVAVDLGSRNGMFVDGVRCKRATLAGGSVLRVGKSLILFAEDELDGLPQAVAEAPPLYGPSVAMSRVRHEIDVVAPTKLPVLVLGETGVGKDLAVSAIHDQSGRKGPLVPVNCAAITPSVAEAELFGHEPGAFTGASSGREGLFAAAEGGTLFLDEVGDLPLDLQPKLLRALALGEVRPVGSNRARRIKVRVVSATHRDLESAVQKGAFRADLLARLSGWVLRIPPLRERREDILPLAGRFLRAHGRSPELSADAAEALLLHDFPRNVRELEHEISAAVARWNGAGALGCACFSEPVYARVLTRDREPAPPSPKIRRERPRSASAPSREELLATLERFHGNVAQVAAQYGKDRHQVYRWMNRFGLDIETLRR